MKSLTDQLTTYASYHRDRRNIATHFIGIPMILYAVVILLSRPLWLAESPLAVSPALFASIAASLYYLRLDIRFGLLMTLILAIMVRFASPIAAESTTNWLSWGVGLFVVGWIFQSIGHIWEGKKPAFLDDVIGLIIGPLFVVSEVVFALGARAELLTAIESKVGKTRMGQQK